MKRHQGIVVTIAILLISLSACAENAKSGRPDSPAERLESASGALAIAEAVGTPQPIGTSGIKPSELVITPVKEVPIQANAPVRTATAAASPTSRKRFLGYYVPYDNTSWLTLEAQAGLIDYVAAQWVTIDACGNLASKDDRTLINFAQAKGIRVLPTLLTSSESLNHVILTDSQVSSHAIQQIVDYVVSEGYDGFDLDFEGVPPADRAALTTFVAKLSQALHQKGKLFSMALPAKTSDTTSGWGGAFEYAALAPHFDFATIMSYAYTLATTPPGSTSPQGWVEKVAAFASSQIPREKILLGVAFYGYDWNITTGEKARTLRYSQGAALAAKYNAKITTDSTSRSATFTYQARPDDVPPVDPKLPNLNHVISSKDPRPCTAPTPTLPAKPTSSPGPTELPKPTPTKPALSQHTVWLEDAESVKARLSIADKYGMAGIGSWRLGEEDPATWTVISTWRKGG